MYTQYQIPQSSSNLPVPDRQKLEKLEDRPSRESSAVGLRKEIPILR